MDLTIQCNPSGVGSGGTGWKLSTRPASNGPYTMGNNMVNHLILGVLIFEHTRISTCHDMFFCSTSKELHVDAVVAFFVLLHVRQGISFTYRVFLDSQISKDWVRSHLSCQVVQCTWYLSPTPSIIGHTGVELWNTSRHHWQSLHATREALQWMHKNPTLRRITVTRRRS